MVERGVDLSCKKALRVVSVGTTVSVHSRDQRIMYCWYRLVIISYL